MKVKTYLGHDVPNGAYHINNKAGCFFNKNKTEYSSFTSKGKWFPVLDSTINDRFRSDAIELPEEETKPEIKPEVRADGLPPVGTSCLTLHYGELVECLYVGKGLGEEFIYQVSSGRHRGEIDRLIGSPRFRPLKTKEEKDREAFILEGLTLQPVLTTEQAGIIEHALGLAFDAGFTAPKGDDGR